MTTLKTRGLRLETQTFEKDGTVRDYEAQTYYINKGKKYTPFEACMDHGEYYEIAKYSWYIRIYKNEMDEVEFNVWSNAKGDEFKRDLRYKAKIVKLDPA